MIRFLIAALVLATACGSSSTEAAKTVDVTITTAARPTTSFVVRNNTSAAVQVMSCAGSIGFAHAAGTSQIRTCPVALTPVTIAAGGSVNGTESIAAAGQYVITVTLSDNSVRSSSAFTVP